MRNRDHDAIDELLQGYQNSQILLTANRLGLFAALGDGIRDSDLVCRHLLPDSPEPRIHLLQHGSRQYERWGRLFDAVKLGRPAAAEDLDPRLSADESDFARAMADVGRRSAAATLDQLDLSAASKLLDIGGGPAIYAIEFARRWPQLDITVLDGAETLAVARENIGAAGLEHRIHTLAGDARVDPLGGPYDAIFISNVLHIHSAVDIQRLVQRCADRLTSGGQLLLKDFFLDADPKRTPGGAIFAVNMLVSTEAGDCYTVSEVQQWLDEADLEYATLREVASRSRLVIALKP